MEDAIHLVMVRDQLPEMSEQVLVQYFAIARMRYQLGKLDALAGHFEGGYAEMRRRLNVLRVIYEFEIIETHVCQLAVC